jgi:predicted nucleic acid-binding Zn ribbon protein
MIPAHSIIPSVVAEILRRAPMSREKVDFAWRAAVGPAIASVTSVRLDSDRVLHVAATEPHWQREVLRSSPLILARLERLLGPGVVARLASDDEQAADQRRLNSK